MKKLNAIHRFTLYIFSYSLKWKMNHPCVQEYFFVVYVCYKQRDFILVLNQWLQQNAEDKVNFLDLYKMQVVVFEYNVLLMNVYISYISDCQLRMRPESQDDRKINYRSLLVVNGNLHSKLFDKLNNRLASVVVCESEVYNLVNENKRKATSSGLVFISALF